VAKIKQGHKVKAGPKDIMYYIMGSTIQLCGSLGFLGPLATEYNMVVTTAIKEEVVRQIPDAIWYDEQNALVVTYLAAQTSDMQAEVATSAKKLGAPSKEDIQSQEEILSTFYGNAEAIMPGRYNKRVNIRRGAMNKLGGEAVARITKFEDVSLAQFLENASPEARTLACSDPIWCTVRLGKYYTGYALNTLRQSPPGTAAVYHAVAMTGDAADYLNLTPLVTFANFRAQLARRRPYIDFACDDADPTYDPYAHLLAKLAANAEHYREIAEAYEEGRYKITLAHDDAVSDDRVTLMTIFMHPEAFFSGEDHMLKRLRHVVAPLYADILDIPALATALEVQHEEDDVSAAVLARQEQAIQEALSLFAPGPEDRVYMEHDEEDVADYE